MVEEMNDYELCVKIGGGDLVALEAKYHAYCLVKYKNKHRSFSRAKCSSYGGSYSKLQEVNQARAFADLADDIGSTVEHGETRFKLSMLQNFWNISAITGCMNNPAVNIVF